MKRYLVFSGTVFAVIALGHLLRLLNGWPAMIGGRVIPLWISGAGLVVAGCLAAWAFRLARSAR